MNSIPYIPIFNDATMSLFWADLKTVLHTFAPAAMIVAAALAMYRVAIMVRDSFQDHADYDARDHRYHDDEDEEE